jgi:hypothetical protein
MHGGSYTSDVFGGMNEQVAQAGQGNRIMMHPVSGGGKRRMQSRKRGGTSLFLSSFFGSRKRKSKSKRSKNKSVRFTKSRRGK